MAKWSDEGISYTRLCSRCKQRRYMRGGSYKNRKFVCKECSDKILTAPSEPSNGADKSASSGHH